MLFARLLLAIVVLQLVFFVVSVALGGGSGGGPFAPLTGPWALFVWLRLVVGLVFPLVVSWAAIQTARTRSMESATGLLYINVGVIAAATIVAAGLYFGAGLLVYGRRSGSHEHVARLRPERRRPRLDRVAGGAAPSRRSSRSRRRPSRSASRSSIARPAGSCPSWPPGGRRIVEVGTADRLLDPVAGARPAGGRDDRDDRPGSLADRPGPRLVARRPGSPTSGSSSSTARPSRRSPPGRRSRRSLGRSTSSSSTP